MADDVEGYEPATEEEYQAYVARRQRAAQTLLNTFMSQGFYQFTIVAEQPHPDPNLSRITWGANHADLPVADFALKTATRMVGEALAGDAPATVSIVGALH